ncbi:hypothetical protein VTI74DRAFT_1584 [Chaetomium olivicolor]
MASTSPSFRYSNGEVATFDYCTARNSMGNFSDRELERLPIDQDSTEDHRTKLQLLLRLLREKLAQEEAATSPP